MLRTLDDWKNALALLIPEAGIVQWGREWILASGRKSPWYADWRRLRGHPGARYNAVWACITSMKDCNVYQGTQYDVMADVPTGVTPLVSCIAYELGIPQVTPHPPKDHGTGATIEGIYKPGDRVVVFDDVATSGQSILSAIDILLEAGLNVIPDVFVVMDREQGAAAKLAERGYNLNSLFNADELLSFFHQHALIDEQNYQTIMAYIHPDSSAASGAPEAAKG